MNNEERITGRQIAIYRLLINGADIKDLEGKLKKLGYDTENLSEDILYVADIAIGKGLTKGE